MVRASSGCSAGAPARGVADPPPTSTVTPSGATARAMASRSAPRTNAESIDGSEPGARAASNSTPPLRARCRATRTVVSSPGGCQTRRTAARRRGLRRCRRRRRWRRGVGRRSCQTERPCGRGAARGARPYRRGGALWPNNASMPREWLPRSADAQRRRQSLETDAPVGRTPCLSQSTILRPNAMSDARSNWGVYRPCRSVRLERVRSCSLRHEEQLRALPLRGWRLLRRKLDHVEGCASSCPEGFAASALPFDC